MRSLLSRPFTNLLLIQAKLVVPPCQPVDQAAWFSARSRGCESRRGDHFPWVEQDSDGRIIAIRSRRCNAVPKGPFARIVQEQDATLPTLRRRCDSGCAHHFRPVSSVGSRAARF